MASHIAVLLLAALSVTLFSNGYAAGTVICYYESWNEYRFPPEDIDVSICTHINYAFLGINPDGSLRLDGNDDQFHRLANLKQQNPNVKLLFSVGGWSEGSAGFSSVAANANAKSNLAQSALWYIQNYGFDGLDIDWEYPGSREGSSAADKENFIDLLWVLRGVFNDNGGYLITIAVSSDPMPDSYNVAALANVVDFINVMTYDFHSSGDGKTGQNSPLYASSRDSEWERTHANCDASISNWLNAGSTPSKTVLGLGFYGKSYTLSDPNNNGVGAPTSGGGSNSAESYPEICSLSGWTEAWDDEQQNPYKYNGNQWIGYDNPRSIALKVQYANSRNLGGVMMWAVDLDDHDGACGPRDALLQEIKNNL